MFPQQVTLSIILLSSLVHNATVAMENTNENPNKTNALSVGKNIERHNVLLLSSSNNTNNNPY